jgi:hypothetical protein
MQARGTNKRDDVLLNKKGVARECGVGLISGGFVSGQQAGRIEGEAWGRTAIRLLTDKLMLKGITGALSLGPTGSGSAPLNIGSGIPDPALLVSDLTRCQPKSCLFFLCLLFFEGTFTSFFKDKKQRIQTTVKI